MFFKTNNSVNYWLIIFLNSNKPFFNIKVTKNTTILTDFLVVF